MKLGKNFLLGIVDEASGAFMPLAFAQSCSYSVTNKLVEVSSPLVGGYDNYRKKTTGWTMKHEGLIGNATLRYTYKGVQYDFISLISTFAKSGEPMLCRWHENDEIKQGLAIVKSVDEVGSVKALAKVSVSLQGTGELKDLDPNNLEGAFAYVISSRSLLLYTISRPIAGFTPFVGNVPATTTWDPVESSRVQQFEPDDDLSFDVAAAVAAVRVTTAQQGVSFVNSTTLHVVLLQTDSRDEQQQLHRYVQPLWWGGYALGDMQVKNTGNVTLFTLPTAGKTGSADRMEVDPSIDILSPGELHIDITGTTGQTAHCCDRTATLDRIFTIYQTSNHIPGVEHPYWALGNTIDSNGNNQKFRCNFRVWANDADGNEICSYDQGSLIPTMQYDTPIPSAQNIHWQLEGLGVDEGGPWNISRSLTSWLEQYNVYYAYDATAQKLTLYSPDSPEDLLLSGVYLDNDPSRSAFGFYDLDSEGKRVPKTFSGVASFESIAVALGNGVMHDVSSLTMVSLMAQPLPAAFTLDVLPLADIVLYAADEVTELARIPMLTTPGTAVASVPEVADYTFAHMAGGATQSLTVRQYRRDVTVSTSVEQTGTAQWTVTAHLKATGTTSATTLPGGLTLQWPSGATLTIPAGQSSATGTLAVNPSWQAPTASLDFWASDSFYITPGSTVDTTPANWKAYKLGTLNSKDLYDIQYVPTNGYVLTLTSDGFTGGDAFIAAGAGCIASHLIRVDAGDTPTVQVRKAADAIPAPATVTFTDTMIITDQPVVLRYFQTYDDNNRTVAKLTDSNRYGITSRRTNIGEELPYMRVRDGSQSSIVPIYNPANICELKPNRKWTDAVVRTDFPEGMNDRTGIVEFTYTPGWGTNIISVGNNIPGLEVYPYWSNNPLPKA